MTAIDARERHDLEDQRDAPLLTPTDLGPAARHDVAAASLIEDWIDETERRTWFLFESGRAGETGGR